MNRRSVLFGVAAVWLAPLASFARELKPYVGPEITRVVVYKERRKLYLLSGTDIVKTYKIGLGNVPDGPKRFEGDGKTPEGSYLINRRNPNSKYYLSLGISYPNVEDVKYAESQGKSPGGDIFIHGRAGGNRGLGRDWTVGCIAVKDRHIEEIYRMVADGTQVDIHP